MVAVVMGSNENCLTEHWEDEMNTHGGILQTGDGGNPGVQVFRDGVSRRISDSAP